MEDQRADPESPLNFAREVIAHRRAFAREPYETLPSREDVWAFRRGPTTVTLNMSDEESEHDGRTLAPWEAVLD